MADPVPGAHTFALTVAVNGGARWEDEARSGWSHLLEHLVFKGAGDMSAREIVERIEAVGGSINAATGQERTSFEVRGVEGTLPLALQVVSDLIFNPTLTPEEIEREKDVVAQEIAEAFDTPDDHVFEMCAARAFAGQPLGRPILGSVASLKPVSHDAIADWRARLYDPSRMVVAVSGAVDETALLRQVEALFGGRASTPVEAPAPARFVGGEAKLARRIEQANLVFQLPGLASDDPDFPALRLFTEILGGGMASRLFQSAREERGLAYAVDAYAEAYQDTGLVGIYAGAAADRAEELAQVAAGETRSLAEDGPNAAELDRAKAVMRAGHLMAEESLTQRAGRRAAQTLVYGAPQSLDTMIGRLTAPSVEDVRAVGLRLLKPGLAATAVLGPRSAGRAGAVFAQGVGG